MKDNLMKHILSKYTNRGEIQTTGNLTIDTVGKMVPYLGGPTAVTENIEMSDPDEFKAGERTLSTRAIENSDADEFMMGDPPHLTHAIEGSDPDEFFVSEKSLSDNRILIERTRNTYTVEISDDDEFLFM